MTIHCKSLHIRLSRSSPILYKRRLTRDLTTGHLVMRDQSTSELLIDTKTQRRATQATISRPLGAKDLSSVLSPVAVSRLRLLHAFLLPKSFLLQSFLDIHVLLKRFSSLYDVCFGKSSRDRDYKNVWTLEETKSKMTEE